MARNSQLSSSDPWGKLYYKTKLDRVPLLKTDSVGGTWAAQSVKRLTLDFRAGHDLTVHGFKPRIGLHADSGEPAWDSLSSLPFPSSLSLSKYINLKKKK